MAKKFNTNNNAYIIIYSVVLVVIVAFCLAFVYTSLKDMQEANVALDVKKQVLASLDVREFADDADAEKQYATIVKDEKVVDEANKAIIYTCELNGETKYILSVKGMGLWGPIWGYVAMNADKETVYGVFFNHEGETAGLGAEIKDSKAWQDKFKAKKAIVDGKVALGVVKGAAADDASNVDCVTGATLTSNGVDEMLKKSLALYSDFLNEK